MAKKRKRVARRTQHQALVRLYADLVGRRREVIVGTSRTPEQHGVLALAAIVPKLPDLQLITLVGSRPRIYPCTLRSDLRAIAAEFANDVLGNEWSVQDDEVGTIPDGNTYRPRRPDDPPGAVYRLTKRDRPAAHLVFNCGGQPGTGTIDLAFAVGVLVQTA